MNRVIFWIVCGLGLLCLLAGFGALVFNGSVDKPQTAPLIQGPANTSRLVAAPVQVTDELQTTPKNAGK
jgi:hypothetical protein